MKSPYVNFAVMLAISAIFMYGLMYLMIDQVSRFHFNLNTLYMTLAMLAPMLVVMLYMMRDMYPNHRLNAALYGLSVVVFFGSIALVRTQTTIDDKEFLRSMIPHHSGAVLMCQKARLTDPEIINLCGSIIKSQKREIAEMEAILARRNR
jgi:uncharacterized protein (DUF305 family)